jgi:hypothetical protein
VNIDPQRRCENQPCERGCWVITLSPTFQFGTALTKTGGSAGVPSARTIEYVNTSGSPFRCRLGPDGRATLMRTSYASFTLRSQTTCADKEKSGGEL